MAAVGLTNGAAMRVGTGLCLCAVIGLALLAGACDGSDDDSRRPSSPTTAEAGAPAGEPMPPATFARCDGEAPRVLEPGDGAVVSGEVVITAELLEGPCFIAACTFVTVFAESGAVVHRGCDDGVPARIRWDTLDGVEDGRYSIRAQRGCRCDVACPELGEAIRVVVQN